MLRVASVIFVLAILSVSAQWTDSSWSDSIESGGFGGVFYVCFEGNRLHGAYSEYGIVQGVRRGPVISGIFYEGGGSTMECNVGNFELIINESGDKFEGFYDCGGEEQFEWAENIIGGPTTTDDYSCAVLKEKGTFAGSYSSGDGYRFDLCLDNGKDQGDYHGSFSFGNGQGGYENGIVYQDNLIGSGIFSESFGNDGISLVFELKDGSLGNFYWFVDDNDIIDTEADYDTSFHNYDILPAIGSASPSECAVFEALEQSNIFESEDSSNILSVTMAIILLALALVL